jgi:hypothetical protein
MYALVDAEAEAAPLIEKSLMSWIENERNMD